MRVAHRPRSGFTIAELLIAVTITVLIVVMLGTMFGSLMKTSNRASQRIDAFRDARAAIQMIERDMANLVHATSTAYFALDDLYPDPNATSQKNRQLYGLIAAKNSGLGDLCAVGYYCRWDPNNHSYSLCRFFTDSPTTFSTLQSNGAGIYASAKKLFTPTSADEVLAAYVWNFQITSYKTDGTVDTTYPLIMGDPSNPTATLPTALEISFQTISPQAARTMMSVSSSPDEWMNAASTNYVRLLKPQAYEFRTRINF